MFEVWTFKKIYQTQSLIVMIGYDMLQATVG